MFDRCDNHTMTKKKSVKITEKQAQPSPGANEETQVATPGSGMAPTFRIISGSYEHNLLCLSLSLYKGKKGGLSELFTPIFHFTAHTASIRTLACTKRYLVSGSNDEHIRIYDLQKRKELGTLLHHDGSITALEFYSNWLISGAGDGKICIWRTKDWEVMSEMKGHKGEVNDLSVHPTGRLLLSAGYDKTLRLWNLMTAKKASILKLRQQPLKCLWTPDGSKFVVGFDRLICIYSAETIEVEEEIKVTSTLQHMEIITIDNKDYLASSHSNGKLVLREFKDNTVGGEEFELEGHAARVKHFSVYHHKPNGVDYMTSVASDGKIVVHDLSKREQIAVYQTGDRLNVCLMVPEDVEKYETMKKRERDEEQSEAEETDLSGESDADQPQRSKKQKKRKNKKKSKITVDFE